MDLGRKLAGLYPHPPTPLCMAYTIEHTLSVHTHTHTHTPHIHTRSERTRSEHACLCHCLCHSSFIHASHHSLTYTHRIDTSSPHCSLLFIIVHHSLTHHIASHDVITSHCVSHIVIALRIDHRHHASSSH